MGITVGLMSPGDMGSVVGARMISGGARVVTCLAGRSERTRQLSDEAGIQDLDSLTELVKTSDLVMSIMVPANALSAAESVAAAIREVGADVPYVDCNAIAPATARAVGEAIEAAGGIPIDAGIIGPPPRKDGATRFYASGPVADRFSVLNDYGLDVRVIGTEIGQASGFKMCYAASTKGASALMLELLIAAERLGLYDALIEEFGLSQEAKLKAMGGLNGVPSKSRRWVGEMEEIAKTFEAVGLTPRMFEGAAAMFQLVGSSDLGDETPETIDRDRPVAELIRRLSASGR